MVSSLYLLQQMVIVPVQVEDHTHRVLWLGPSNTLVIDVLRPFTKTLQEELASGLEEAEVLWKHHT